MTTVVLEQHRRLVPVEFGVFYFGSWPAEDGLDPPHLRGHEAPSVAFGHTALGFYSDCATDELALLHVCFYDSEPDDTDRRNGTSHDGEFVIRTSLLTAATTDMDPQQPFSPPFHGCARVRVQHLELGSDDDPAARDKWAVDIWPGDSFSGRPPGIGPQ